MSTYREMCIKLHKDLTEKLARHYRAEENLNACSDNLIDQRILVKRNKTYKEWQDALRAYNEFLSHVVRIGKSLDDEISDKH